MPRRATRSCWSATTATRRSKARWARRPEQIVLVQCEHDVEELQVQDPSGSPTSPRRRSRWMKRATSSPACKERFPSIVGPRTDDICYATTNRQAAVKQMAASCDLMLVIGSRNSSNSVRLVEVARDCGTDAHLIDNAGEVREEWLDGRRVVGISSGASAPENLVAGAGRVLPRARRARHLRVRRDSRGRALHAAQADSRARAAGRRLLSAAPGTAASGIRAIARWLRRSSSRCIRRLRYGSCR